MKKFECNGCVNHCVLTTNDNCCPVLCHLVYEDWHEVKEESVKVERSAKALPDWCKVERHGHDNEQKRYFEIVYIDENGLVIKYLDNGENETACHSDMSKCSEAKKRPFNEKEMRSLLGKVIMDGDNALFVSMHYGKEKCITAGCLINFDGDDLMRCTCEDKPCYKLEHRNEKGEWVE